MSGTTCQRPVNIGPPWSTICVYFFLFTCVAEAPGTHCFPSFSAQILYHQFIHDCYVKCKRKQTACCQKKAHLTSPHPPFSLLRASHHASNIPHTAWGSTEASDTVFCESPMYIEVAFGSPLGWSLYPQPVRMSHTVHRKVGGYVPPIQRDVLH